MRSYCVLLHGLVISVVCATVGFAQSGIRQRTPDFSFLAWHGASVWYSIGDSLIAMTGQRNAYVTRLPSGFRGVLGTSSDTVWWRRADGTVHRAVLRDSGWVGHTEVPLRSQRGFLISRAPDGSFTSVVRMPVLVAPFDSLFAIRRTPTSVDTIVVGRTGKRQEITAGSMRLSLEAPWTSSQRVISSPNGTFLLVVGDAKPVGADSSETQLTIRRFDGPTSTLMVRHGIYSVSRQERDSIVATSTMVYHALFGDIDAARARFEQAFGPEAQWPPIRDALIGNDGTVLFRTRDAYATWVLVRGNRRWPLDLGDDRPIMISARALLVSSVTVPNGAILRAIAPW